MNRDTQISPLENIVFYVGLLIITGLVSYLIFQSFQDKNLPPDLKISIASMASKECAFKVMVENKGGTSAKDVNIVFNLFQMDEKTESSTVSIDYMPVDSKKTLWVVFKKSTSDCGSLRVGSLAFLKP